MEKQDPTPDLSQLSLDNKTFYVTTAINYTNGPPHMGHAYEAISAVSHRSACRVITKNQKKKQFKIFFCFATLCLTRVRIDININEYIRILLLDITAMQDEMCFSARAQMSTA